MYIPVMERVNICKWQESIMRRSAARSKIRNFIHNEEGATAIEYAMIAAGISITIITGVTLIGGNLKTMYEAVAALF